MDGGSALSQHWFNVLVLAGAFQFEHLFTFERLIQVLNGLFQEKTILVFERRSERSVHSKRTAKIVQNGRSEREAG